MKEFPKLAIFNTKARKVKKFGTKLRDKPETIKNKIVTLRIRYQWHKYIKQIKNKKTIIEKLNDYVN